MRQAQSLPQQINPVPKASSISLPAYGRPVEVSILIPAFGHVDYTLRCLASIAAAPPNVPIEVIVVDDASGDRRASELQSVHGLRLVVNTENRGFLRTCNETAPLAQGAFLFFLNNDTEVMPGAIDALWQLLAGRSDVGMAGARLLYPDGWQQEAGGIVWRDGTAWNYGNRDDPRKPEYGYVREADYVSGAAIMLPKTVWDSLGGFDEIFAPAYCEDSDLAFRVRQAGMKVLYQPDAKIIHFEGISHGIDVKKGVKAYQKINQEKLAARWRSVLRRDHLSNGQRVMRARDRSLYRTVTLVIDYRVPEPNRDAGSRTIVAFMDALQATGRVVKFFPLNNVQTPGYTSALQQRGIEVIYGPWSRGFDAWIAEAGGEIDEVLVSRPEVANECLDALRTHCRAPIVYYGHDLHHARLRTDPEAALDAAKRAIADATERLERLVWRCVDVVLYPSDEEVTVVRSLAPGVAAFAIQPYVLPAPPPVHGPPGPTGGLIFVAGFAHPPNVDAAIWLVTDILPLVRAVRSDIKLALIGSNPTQAVLDLSGDGVEVSGFVTEEELARRYRTARVAVCPLRFGAGVKMKVVEAMHHGVPLVTTPAGAQGLQGVEDVCDVHAAADMFATAVVRLIDDDALWTARARTQSDYVAARFTSTSLRVALDDAFAAARSVRQGSRAASLIGQ
jgi:GT2 family glycosyltransferase